MDNEFLPVGYEPPKSNSRYTKFEDGKTVRLRILDKPLLGWIYWERTGSDAKPIRLPYNEESYKTAKEKANLNPKKEDKKVNHFWNLIVWNYETKMTEVWELTQKTIQASIRNYISDEEFGSPVNYDIKITKKKDGDRTNYDIAPGVPKEIPSEAIDELSKNPINLRALLYSADPFDASWIEAFEA